MSFIFPRVIAISRLEIASVAGAAPYRGSGIVSAETILFTGVPASIQSRGATGQKAGIPADTKGVPVWIIIIPLGFDTIVSGSIIDRDVVTDDLDVRYQVSAAYWNSLGYQLECQRLQT